MPRAATPPARSAPRTETRLIPADGATAIGDFRRYPDAAWCSLAAGPKPAVPGVSSRASSTRRSASSQEPPWWPTAPPSDRLRWLSLAKLRGSLPNVPAQPIERFMDVGHDASD